MYFTQAGQGRPTYKGDIDLNKVKEGVKQKPCNFWGVSQLKINPWSKAVWQKYIWHVPSRARKGTGMRSENGQRVRSCRASHHGAERNRASLPAPDFQLRRFHNRLYLYEVLEGIFQDDR